MEVGPPYLFGSGEHVRPGLSVGRGADPAMIEVAVHGQWSRQLCLDTYTVLRKCMAEQPSAIIVDLRDLSDLDAASANMWLAAARAANDLNPPAQIVLSMPPTRQLAHRLRRLGAVRYLPIFVTMQQARAAVAARLPLTDRLHLSRLRPEPASVTTSAGLATVACDAWDLPNLMDTSRQIMSELVANAIKHAGTDMAVTVSRRGTGIYLSVRDGDPRLPQLLNPAAENPRTSLSPGRGLRMVHDRARAWGAMPAEGGKMVWAILRAGRRWPR